MSAALCADSRWSLATSARSAFVLRELRNLESVPDRGSIWQSVSSLFVMVDTPWEGAYDAAMKRAVCLVCVSLMTLTAQAQQPAPAAPRPSQPPPPAQKSGNPTPGTPQPDPPIVADRIAVTGCLQLAPGAGPAPASAATEPASNRFVLNDVKKDAKVSPDTGTSAAAAASSAASYRLEALESQLTPFLNTRVELSGGLKPPLNGSPVLLVEFVRKIAPKCQ